MHFIGREELPSPLPPRVWCDFNACGWSGAEDDDCYYQLDAADIDAIQRNEGTTVLLYDWEDDEETEVLVRVGRLEFWQHRLRARPVGGFYSGPRPW